MSDMKRVVRILMVDDDRDDLFLTEICFRQTSLPVEFVALESAEALFAYIKDNGIGSIDVLLLDLNMPVTNGLETLKVLKSYPHYSELSVFMFSTSAHAEHRLESLNSGARGYINKPSSLNQMKAFVEEIGQCLKEKELSMAG